MRKWGFILLMALSSVIITACSKSGSGNNASTPESCTINAYGQYQNQQGFPCQPGYGQYGCLGNTYYPPGMGGGYQGGAYPTPYQPGPGYNGYNQGSYMTPGGMPAGNCSAINFQNTFPYNVYGQQPGCQGWSAVYPGSIYQPVNVGGQYVCVNINSMPWMSGMGGYNNMYTCIPGMNCGSRCQTSTSGFGLMPFFWLGGSFGVCY